MKSSYPKFNLEPAQVTNVIKNTDPNGKSYFFADVFEPERKNIRVFVNGKQSAYVDSLRKGDGIKIRYGLDPKYRQSGKDGMPDTIQSFGISRAPEFDRHPLMEKGVDGKNHRAVIRGRVIRKSDPYYVKSPDFTGQSGSREHQNLVLSTDTDIPGVYTQKTVSVPRKIADTVDEDDLIECRPYISREIAYQLDENQKPVQIGTSDSGTPLYKYQLDENGFAKTRITGLRLSTDNRKYFRNLSKGQFPFVRPGEPVQDLQDARKSVQPSRSQDRQK